MRRYQAPTFAFLAGAICLGLACAADPGDPLKTSGSAVSGSSGSSSGGNPGGSSSSGGGSSSGNPGGSSSSGGSSSGNPGGSSSSSGGSSSGSPGDGGTGGDGPAETGPILPEGGASCITAGCALKVQWETPSTDGKTIAANLNIINTGSAPVDLANVRVHYYFTADGDSALVFNCDYAGYTSGMSGFAAGNVTGTFVPMGASSTPYTDTFLELSFTSAPLPANAAASVNFRIHDAAYAVTYNQMNDWSRFSTLSAASYVDANYITAYLAGVLDWGIEPGPLPADSGSRDASQDAGDASPADTGAPADAADGG